MRQARGALDRIVLDPTGCDRNPFYAQDQAVAIAKIASVISSDNESERQDAQPRPYLRRSTCSDTRRDRSSVPTDTPRPQFAASRHREIRNRVFSSATVGGMVLAKSAKSTLKPFLVLIAASAVMWVTAMAIHVL
jgi:hypothetical protein